MTITPQTFLNSSGPEEAAVLASCKRGCKRVAVGERLRVVCIPSTSLRTRGGGEGGREGERKRREGRDTVEPLDKGHADTIKLSFIQGCPLFRD